MGTVILEHGSERGEVIALHVIWMPQKLTIAKPVMAGEAGFLQSGCGQHGSTTTYAAGMQAKFPHNMKHERNIMGRRKLTTDDDVLRAIVRLSKQMGFPPTCEELRREVNLGSTRTVSRYLASLKNSKRIFRWSGARGIQVLKKENK